MKLDSTTVSAAAQAGFDYKLAGNWFMNADVKYVQIESDLKHNGNKLGTV